MVVMDESPLARLLSERRRFVVFVRRQVADDAAAEDIVQAAFARATQAAVELRSRDRAIAWFYRILRNAIVDHYRRRSASENALAKLARESAIVVAPPRGLV